MEESRTGLTIASCMENLKALFDKLRYDERVSEIMTLTLRLSLINLYETHWQRFVSYCPQKINVFQVWSQHFCRYLVELFEDIYRDFSRTSVASTLRHWKCDPAVDPNVKILLHGIRLARPASAVQQNATVEPSFGVVGFDVSAFCLSRRQTNR